MGESNIRVCFLAVPPFKGFSPNEMKYAVKVNLLYFANGGLRDNIVKGISACFVAQQERNEFSGKRLIRAEMQTG